MSAGERRVRAELPAEPRSALVARRLVRSALHGWQLEHLEDTAALLVSELATNALLHARSSFVVQAEQHEEVVRVSVFDTSAVDASRRHHGLSAGTGRGLGLVESLSCAWGTGSGDQPWRKVVWFELPTDPAAVSEDALLAGWCG